MSPKHVFKCVKIGHSDERPLLAACNANISQQALPLSRIEYFVLCFRLIRLIPTDHPNDHSVPDRPFRIQDRIPSRTNELILLSSLRWWYMYNDSMSICLYVMLCVMCVYHKSKMKSWPTYQSVMMLISNWGPVPWCSLELISMSSLRSGELISELMSFWHILDILDIYWIYWTYTGHILDIYWTYTGYIGPFWTNLWEPVNWFQS